MLLQCYGEYAHTGFKTDECFVLRHLIAQTPYTIALTCRTSCRIFSRSYYSWGHSILIKLLHNHIVIFSSMVAGQVISIQSFCVTLWCEYWWFDIKRYNCCVLELFDFHLIENDT